MDFDGLAKRRGAAATALAVLACAGLASCGPGPQAPAPAKPSSGPPSVELSPEQLLLIRVGTVAEQDFAQQVETVGSIDFDEDRTVQVFSPYQGKIIQTYSQLGDDVRQGQPLFTVESPDLMAAGSTLISAEATETANARALDRARKLHETQGISEQNLEAAVSAEASTG